MWPLDLPAREVLKLPGETGIPWAVFDWQWYLHSYPEVGRDIAAGRWKCALHHYLCNESATAFDPLASFSES